MKKKIFVSGLIVGSVIVSGLTIKFGPSFKGSSEALGAAAADSCNTAFQAVVAAEPVKGTYVEPILYNMHDQLYRFNEIQAADVEMIFCRLINIMGVNPDLSNLPQTATVTDPQGGTVTVTVTAPKESFATSAGYTAKAVLAFNGTTFMTFWWAGSGTSSKGYLIQGSNPMATDGMTRLRYIVWDRSTATQIVKVWATQFATSFLTNTSGSSGSKTGGDAATFGRVSYNTSTNAVTGQSIEIRTTAAFPTTFMCVRTAFYGTLGGTITAFRPAKGTPEAVTDTYTDGTDMDGAASVTDATTTAASKAQQVDGTSMTTTFDWACNDVDTAANTGSPFANGAVSYTTDPSTIFPK